MHHWKRGILDLTNLRFWTKNWKRQFGLENDFTRNFFWTAQVKIGKLNGLKEINVLTYDDDQLGLIFNQNSQMIRCQVQPSGKRLSRIWLIKDTTMVVIYSWVKVAETINNYFINVAVDIGNKIKPDCGYGDHPGVKIIREHLPQNQSLSFRHTNENEVAKILHSLNPKKATGPDKIPPKPVKMAKPVISVTIAGMINNSIETGTFPDALKKADVTPVF